MTQSHAPWIDYMAQAKRSAHRAVARKLLRFSADQRGIMAVAFAIMAALAIATIGGAIDYGRWLSAKSKTLNAIDAAALAGGRVLQLSDKTEADALAAAKSYYAQNRSAELSVDDTSFTVKNNEIVATSNSAVKTPFLKIAGIDSLPVKVGSRAVIMAGGGNHLEIALMLDTTGSMGGDKMKDLKIAAKDLIDIVVWKDQSEWTSRVALAPFSYYVNVGSKYFHAIAGPDAGVYDINTTEEVEEFVPVQEKVCTDVTVQIPKTTCQKQWVNGVRTKVCTTTYKDKKVEQCTTETVMKEQTVTKTITTQFDIVSKGDKYTCIKERSTSDRYTDAKPDVANYFGYFGDVGSEQDHILNNHSSCDPSSTITPLTSDKSVLKSKIDAMPTTGMTAGHLGTQWAWYLMSPKWNDVWPDASKANPYSMLSEKTEDGTPKLYKIAVLMTDGSYNQDYSGSSSTTQAREICKQMKEAGITVYSIGFMIANGSTPDETMQQCASNPSNYYNASDGEALKQAFRDIALKISELRLAE